MDHKIRPPKINPKTYHEQNEQKIYHEQNEQKIYHEQTSQKPKRKRSLKSRLLTVTLDVLIVALIATGLYLFLRPKWIHYQQDKTSNEILELFEEGEGPIRFTVDPNANKVPGEELGRFW